MYSTAEFLYITAEHKVYQRTDQKSLALVLKSQTYLFTHNITQFKARFHTHTQMLAHVESLHLQYVYGYGKVVYKLKGILSRQLATILIDHFGYENICERIFAKNFYFNIFCLRHSTGL